MLKEDSSSLTNRAGLKLEQSRPDRALRLWLLATLNGLKSSSRRRKRKYLSEDYFSQQLWSLEIPNPQKSADNKIWLINFLKSTKLAYVTLSIVVLVVDQPSGFTYLQEVYQAIRSTYLFAYISWGHITSVCQSWSVFSRRINSLMLIHLRTLPHKTLPRLSVTRHWAR